MIWDVVVAGAGPAGCAAALVLAREGLEVLLLERYRPPRYKVCAGVFSMKAIRLLQSLGLDIAPLARTRLGPVLFTLRGADPVVVEGHRSLAQLLDRSESDRFLAEHAAQAGAQLRDGTRVIRVETNWRECRVHTSEGLIRSQYVIGADGGLSAVARSLDLGPSPGRMGWAVEQVLPASKAVNGAQVDLAAVPGGYFWVFPRGEEASVGLGTCAGPSRGLKSRLVDMMKSRGLEPLPRTRGHPLSALPSQRRLGRHRVLLAGDAAGLVDSLTGEGIYSALRSGTEAARAILGASEGNALSLYSSSMRSLLSDLRWARWLSDLFYRVPGAFYRWFRPGSRLDQCFQDLVEGQLAYSQVPRFLVRRRCP